MEEDDISIQIGKVTTTWIEKFEKCDEMEVHQPNCQFSPCGRFSFTISGNYLDIVDTICGARLRLQLDDKIQPVNLLNYTLSGFYPTNRYSGVLFWTQVNGNGILFGRKCWKSFAARFRINYECGVLCQEGAPLQFKGLMRPLTVLDHGRIILTCEAKIYGDQRFEVPVNYTFRQFNLNTMQHFGPSINNRVVETCRRSLYSWCNMDMLTWYKDKIYQFNMMYGNEGMQQLRQQSSYIIEYSKEDGKRRVKLDNYLACLDQNRDNSISYIMVDRNFTTKWHKHLLFARISFPIQNPYLKLAFEQHFAVFNLETMRWRPLDINQMPISTIAPWSMSVTENTLVFVNSTAGQGFYLNRMFYHAKQKHHVQVGNHNHANVHRIPLNRPETLENLSLTTLNHIRPDWKVHSTFLHSQNLLWPFEKRHYHTDHRVLRFNRWRLYLCTDCLDQKTTILRNLDQKLVKLALFLIVYLLESVKGYDLPTTLIFCSALLVGFHFGERIIDAFELMFRFLIRCLIKLVKLLVTLPVFLYRRLFRR